MPAIRIDVSAIPSYQAIELAECAVRQTKLLFSLPGMEDEYLEWLAERQSKKEVKK